MDTLHDGRKHTTGALTSRALVHLQQGILAAVALLVGLVLATAAHADQTPVTPATPAVTQGVLLKTPTCDCCSAWGLHMRKNKFVLEEKNVERQALARFKEHFGLKREHMSCHTARIDGYTIEGHVPAEDVARLLAEKPKGVIGLSVPGMPIGSPGMEQGEQREPFDVLLIKKDGTTEVWASHNK